MTLPICLGCSLPLQKRYVQRQEHQGISCTASTAPDLDAWALHSSKLPCLSRHCNSPSMQRPSLTLTCIFVGMFDGTAMPISNYLMVLGSAAATFTTRVPDASRRIVNTYSLGHEQPYPQLFVQQLMSTVDSCSSGKGALHQGCRITVLKRPLWGLRFWPVCSRCNQMP